MDDERSHCKTAVINSDVIVVGGYGDTCGNGCRYSVEHFKIHKRDLFMGRKVKPWSYKADPLNENFVVFDKREHCCISSFKQNYMIGGWKPYQYLNNEFINSCFVYNLKLDRWSQIAGMNKKRSDAACTVFEGKIVVSGGQNNKLIYKSEVDLSSVEAYDYFENKWTYLSDMNEERCQHALVSMGNKMFVIGGYKKSTCEFFDSLSRKFCFLKTSSYFTPNMRYFQAMCIDNRIVIFGEVFSKILGSIRKKVFTYNDETSEWKLIDISFLKYKTGLSCVKYYE